MTTRVVDVWALVCVTSRSLAGRGWVLQAEVPGATTDVPVDSVRVNPLSTLEDISVVKYSKVYVVRDYRRRERSIFLLLNKT